MGQIAALKFNNILIWSYCSHFKHFPRFLNQDILLVVGNIGRGEVVLKWKKTKEGCYYYVILNENSGFKGNPLRNFYFHIYFCR